MFERYYIKQQDALGRTKIVGVYFEEEAAIKALKSLADTASRKGETVLISGDERKIRIEADLDRLGSTTWVRYYVEKY